MKKINKLVLILAFSLVSISSLFAQNQIIIQSVLIPPYPVYYSDITTMPGLATVIVQNTDMNNSYTLRFRMKLDGGNGVSLLLTEEVIPSNPISIGPGEVRTLTGDDFASIYHGIGLEDLVVTGVSEKSVLQSQRIPDGIYKLCVQAFSNDNVKPLSGYEPTGCSNKMQIITIEPPVILSPLDEAQITATDPQQILMRWTTVNSATAAMLYDIRIAEVPEGVSPYEAMRTDNLLFFEELDYPATVFSYGPSFPSLVSGKNYALQIKAHDATDNANIRNGGKSDVVTFSYLLPLKTGGLNFSCADPCPSHQPVSNRTNIDNLQSGDEITIGDFTATITEVTKTGTRFSGKALLNTSSFFVFPIWMRFGNIGVNTNYEVYHGLLKAELRDEMTQSNCYDTNEGFQPSSDEDMEDIYDLILNPARAITVSFGNPASPGVHAGISLPVGYGNEDQNVAITKMVLSPTSANMNLITGYTMSGDFRNGEANFIFGVKRVCITPGGPASGNNNTTIALLRDVDYFPNSNYTVRFLPGDIRNRKGCYGNISCDGLESVHLGGVVAFDKNLIVPENDEGNIIPNTALAGKFSIETDDPNDWIAQIEFRGTTTIPNTNIASSFRIVGFDDYSFSLQHIFLDNSLSANPQNAVFPVGYLGRAENTWNGVFVKNYTVRMPNYFNSNDTNRMEIGGQNFIFDDQGYTFEIDADDVLTKNQNGQLDGWDFTIQNFQLEMLRSELQNGRMNGEIKLEIASNYVNYNAQMSIIRNTTRYNFDVQTGRNLDVDMWSATITLDPTSSVGIQIINSDVEAEANLTGSITLDESVGGIGGISFEGIAFENLQLFTHSPYIGNAHFDLVGSGVNSFGGFDVEIDNVNIKPITKNLGVGNTAKKALSFDMDMGFGSDNSGFSAEANFEIIAKKSRNSKLWSYDDINVGDIVLKGEVSTVKVDGVINWYNNDPVFGNGYRGAVAATFFDDFLLQTELLFGTKDDFEYWYVDGATKFPSVAPFAGALGLKGFGGGAYYNMLPRGAYTPMQLGTVNPQPNYIPRENGWGFKALVILATSPDESTFNGNAQVEMAFRGNVISKIGFNGEFALMRTPPVGENANQGTPMIYLEGTIDMNNSRGNKYLDAEFGYDINIPTNPRLIWGKALNGAIGFHDAGANDWYLHLGSPTNMLDLNIGVDYDIFDYNVGFSVGSKSYFCIGSELPPPPVFPPAGAPRELSALNVSDGNTDASGVMMGTHLSFNMPEKTAFSIWGNGIKFRAGAGLGFDMGLKHINGALCNGRRSFGINNWRADARGYLYGFAHLKGEIMYHEFNIAGGSFTAGMQAIMPNPTYFGAAVSLSVDLPVYGDFTLKTSFNTGETCEYDMDESFMEDLALDQLISSFELSQDVDSVYAYDKGIYAVAKMNIPIGRTKSYTMADNKVLRTKVGYEVVVFKRISDVEIEVISSLPLKYNIISSDRHNVRISGAGRGEEIRVYLTDGYRNALTQPGGAFGVKLKAKLMYSMNNEPFRVLVGGDNKAAMETEIIRFVTKKPKNEKIQNVVSAIPAVNERFFYLGDYTGDNQCYITYSNDSLFDAYGQQMAVGVTYEDVYDGSTYYAQAALSKRTKTITYSIPRSSTIRIDARTGRTYEVAGDGIALRNGRIYEVKFYVGARSEREIGESKEIYKYYCRTSKYNTLIDKLNDLRVYSKHYKNSNSPLRYVSIKFALQEPFGKSELRDNSFEYIDMFTPATQERNQWASQRSLLEFYARANDIDLSFLAPEFHINETQYKLLRDLTQADINEAIHNGYSNDKPINLEIDWTLNTYTKLVWIFTKLHQDSNNDDDNNDDDNKDFDFENRTVNNSAKAYNVQMLNNYNIDWNSYSYDRFLRYDVNNMRNEPYISSPYSFDAKIRINGHVFIDINLTSVRGGGVNLDYGNGKTGGGKTGGGKTEQQGGGSGKTSGGRHEVIELGK